MQQDDSREIPAGVALCQGIDLPQRAARLRAGWLPGRQGREAVLLLALAWVRDCPDAVRVAEQHLDQLFADYPCTPGSWSEAQAVRQVLALFNQRLYRARPRPAGSIELGVLLLQGADLVFFQVGDIGLLRWQGGVLQACAGRSELELGRHAELAVVQHKLLLTPGEVLLLAPQALLALDAGAALAAELAQGGDGRGRLAQLARAPGAALLLHAVAGGSPPLLPVPAWPAVAQAHPGLCLDGWTLLGRSVLGPPGRSFLAEDAEGRRALLCLAEQAADEAFWQREWALRRSAVPSLPALLSPRRARTRAYWLWTLPPPGAEPLAEWRARQSRLEPAAALALLDAFIEALRALQRRGLRGLLLGPSQVLRDGAGRLLLLPELALAVPGVHGALLPQAAGWQPLAPELRLGEVEDSRAEQFLLAAWLYWLLSGSWPACACADEVATAGYLPLAGRVEGLPPGWDGVLARALAPRPQARYAALSELRQALEDGLQVARAHPPRPGCRGALVLLGASLGLLLLALSGVLPG